MKSIVIVCFLAMLNGHVCAQPASAAPQANTIDAERLAIGAERARLEAGFLAEDAACHKKFAVNSCLGNVNTRRQESTANFRRQEILLNDEERKIKGAEQIRKTEQKSSLEKQQEDIAQRSRANEDYRLRQEREKSKKQEPANVQANEKTARNANVEKLLRHQKKAAERSSKQAAAAEEAKKYADRQNDAQKRRAQHESEKAKQIKPPAKSLPLPAQ